MVTGIIKHGVNALTKCWDNEKMIIISKRTGYVKPLPECNKMTLLEETSV